MTGGVSRLATAAGPSGEQKRKGETPTGGWYSFYGKYSEPTVQRHGRAVLQLHPTFDLLHNGPVHKGVRMYKRREAVHEVLLLG